MPWRSCKDIRADLNIFCISDVHEMGRDTPRCIDRDTIDPFDRSSHTLRTIQIRRLAENHAAGGGAGDAPIN